MTETNQEKAYKILKMAEGSLLKQYNTAVTVHGVYSAEEIIQIVSTLANVYAALYGPGEPKPEKEQLILPDTVKDPALWVPPANE
ncbi:MAG: hypothetical protein LRY54_01260 [Alphaproteobacteria bacterium]|nr:hypothetical protein [Alphaproteobacteria bacterium]